MLTKQEVASFLLSEGYLLTALEFHQELVEDGSELDILKKQFGAPPPQSSDLYSLNTESIKLPDNVEAAMKEKDDRLTLLEYELRMAKQQVNQMREKLNKTSLHPSSAKTITTATLSSSSTFKGNSRIEVVSDLESAAPRDSEIRAINYIVMKYLLNQGFKVSAVTFEEEVSDQSVSDWEEIGINSPPPPSLTTFYRYFYTVDPNAPNPNAAATASKGMETIISSLKEEIDQLKKRAIKAEEKHSHYKKKIDILLADKKALEEKMATMETSLQHVDTPTPSTSEEAKPVESTPEAPPKKLRKPRRTYVEVDPNPFNIVEETESYTRISQELRMIAQERDFQSLVHILGDALPHIVPGVILKKREELIPVILSAISQHPDPNNRYSLTGLLFNLIRRPNEHERKILIDGFDSLARIIGEERTERELLPQCWEQIHDEHDERRVLVADSCGAISKYVRAELRPSLILSILQQLSQDKSHIVRQAVARNLGVLVSYFTGNEKYSQVEELVFELLNDSEADVRAVAVRVLLPIFADWADDLEWMTSKFLTKFLSEIETQLSSNDDVSLSVLFTALKSLIPRIRDSILWSIPIPPTGSQDPIKQLQYRIEQLSQHLEKETTAEIPELEWLLNTCLPKLTMFILKIDVSKEKASQDFINVLSTLCSVFGDTFTTITMKKVFQPHLEKEQRGKVLPFYIGGVIACVKKQKEVFSGYLKEVILNVSLEENGWKRTHKNALRDAVRLLSKTDRKDETLSLLSELVVHTASHVRSVIVALFDALVVVLHSEEVIKRVLPALVTLSADPDPAVRLESIQALGLVAVNVEDPIVLDKVKFQFESFIEDDSHNHRVTITKVFTNMIPHVQAHFRDHFILPNLVKITERNARNPDTSHKLGLAQLLFEAYRAYTGCLIDEESVKEQLLPGLKLLQRESDHMESAYKSMITTMISEFEATIKSDAPGSIVKNNSGGSISNTATASTTEGFGKYFTGFKGGVADIKKKVNMAVATPGQPTPAPTQPSQPVKRP